MQETQVMRVQSLGQEEPLEAEMATDSRILAWEIPWTEELGRLQSMESQRVGHNWAHTQTRMYHQVNRGVWLDVPRLHLQLLLLLSCIIIIAPIGPKEILI